MLGRRTKIVISAGLAVLAAYGLAAYVAAPLLWSRIERDAPARPHPMLTTTVQGIPGDPINVGLVGSREQILRAFAAIGWSPADPVTLKTSVEIGLSVALRSPYRDAPVSTLIFEGRGQDLAFEKEDGASAGRRHHLRLWRSLRPRDDARPLWLGSASFDRDAGFSHDTGQVTHHIAPDIDAERDGLIGDLDAARLLDRAYSIPGIGPTSSGRNGGGDLYVTDGLARVGVLKP